MSCVEDVVAAVPHVLGFHPAESVVMLVSGSRSMGARIDLPETAEECEAAVEAMCRAAAAAVPEVAFLVVYSEGGGAVGQIAGAAAGMVTALLGVPCRGVVVTAGGAGEVSEGGRLLGPMVAVDHTSHRFSAEAVLHGRPSPLGGREALRDRVSAVGEPLAGVDEAARRLAAVSPEGLRPEARWLLEAFERAVSGGPGLSDVEAARVMAGVAMVPLRDVVWSAITRERAEAWVEVLGSLLRRAPDQAVPPLATLLGIAAWLTGDGALSWCALDRSAEVDPTYSLANTVANVLEAGLPPWRALEAMPSTDDALAALVRA